MPSVVSNSLKVDRQCALAIARAGRTMRRRADTACLFAVLGLLCLVSCGCLSNGPGVSAGGSDVAMFPPPPQSPHVVALGNLRVGGVPTSTQVKLSMFLFGAEPEPGLAWVKPTALRATGGGVCVADSAAGGLLWWTGGGAALREQPLAQRVRRPIALEATADGGWLVVDGESKVALRFTGDGHVIARYARTDAPYRPTGVAAVGDSVWVANAAASAIDVFERDSGRYTRSIGAPGRGPLGFSAPLRMAAAPEGGAFVVDMLHGRVAQLAADGSHVRDIGRPGDVVGCLGRPKDVAVGPDGTVFVTDAAYQRVQVFDGQGHSLLAFGEPGSGAAALAIPDGICISRTAPTASRNLPAGFTPDYYVLVAEQLRDPGVRVYAWRRGDNANTRSAAAPRAQRASAGAATVQNPHCSATACTACHGSGTPGPISVAQADRLCLSCHDGQRASAEAHPIARLASAPGFHVPAAWPLADGRIACLTCHDIRRHCDRATARPAANAALLRDYDADRPTAFCTNCHSDAGAGRINPHRQVTSAGLTFNQTCVFCHQAEPAKPADGVRKGEPHLRIAGSDLCLTCHTKHWDVSPRGHVERPVTAVIRANMLAGDLRLRGVTDEAAIARRQADRTARPTLLPLEQDRVTCYSCHSPHAPGLFPAGSELAAHSDRPEDAGHGLRIESGQMCLYCHGK